MDLDQLKAECDVETYAASSGSGGQNVNKRDTAVRVTHRPTGLKAASKSHATQGRNLREALKRLARKIAKAQEIVAERIQTEPSKASVEKRLDKKRRASRKKSQRAISHDD